MPGLRGTPDVMTTTSEFAVSFQPASSRPPITPRVRALDRARLVACRAPTPCAFWSAMSMMTTSASSLSAMRARDRRADVAGAADDCHFAIHECASATSSPYMFAMIASANCDVLSSVAPSIWRARS